MDDITNFLVAGPNLPFLVTGCLVLATLVIELMMLVIGYSIMLGHGDIDFTLDADGNGIPDYLEHGSPDFFSWINPGHLPSSMLIVVFCGVFSLLGFSGQWIYNGLTHGLAPMLLTVPIVIAGTLPFVRGASIGIAKAMPSESTSAISLSDLVGEIGVLTAGPVKGQGDFGMARFTDKHGMDHQLMVSVNDDTIIANGESVVLMGPHPDNAIAYVVRKI